MSITELNPPVVDENPASVPVAEKTHLDKITFQADKNMIVYTVGEERELHDSLMDKGYVNFGYGLHARRQATKELKGEVETYAVRLVREDQQLVRLNVFYRLQGLEHSSRANGVPAEYRVW